MGTQIAPADLTWLLMDRPNNLMHVNTLLTFDRLPDWDVLNRTIFDRMVSKYRVLSQHPARRNGEWVWEDDIDFSMARHLRITVLADSSRETMREYISSQLSEPFDRKHPLWDMQLLIGPPGDEGTGGLFGRFHHGLGDGIRLVQVLLGTCDPMKGAAPRAVGRGASGGSQGPLETVVHVTEHTIRDTIDYVAHAGEAAARASRSAVATMNPLQLPHHLESALDYVRHPVKLMDAVTSFASDDNEWSNTWREVGRMLLSERADAGAWSGHPGVNKSVAWLEGVDLGPIRTVAKAYGGTVNDALLAAVSLALTDYLAERGVTEIHDLGWLMPVSLRPIDHGLPATLGNHFAVVLLSMPLGIREPQRLIEEVRGRTTRLKNSAEPIVAFGLQRVIAEAPGTVAKRLTDYFSNKSIGQLTNVPGPQLKLTYAGAPVHSVLGWVPMSGDQPLGVCIFTYNGTVGVGVSADTRMIPDPTRITDLIEENIHRLLAATEGRGDLAAPVESARPKTKERKS